MGWPNCWGFKNFFFSRLENYCYNQLIFHVKASTWISWFYHWLKGNYQAIANLIVGAAAISSHKNWFFFGLLNNYIDQKRWGDAWLTLLFVLQSRQRKVVQANNIFSLSSRDIKCPKINSSGNHLCIGA